MIHIRLILHIVVIYYTMKKVGISKYAFFKNLIPSIYFLHAKFSGYFVFKPLILVGEIKKTII